MSSRRDAQKTDETVDSGISSLAVAIERNLKLEEKLEEEDATPQDVLHRLLSTKSAISTTSSFARSQQAAVGTRAPFREIGVGSIGRVFGQPGTPWAYKVLLLDRTEKLWNNYVVHLRVQQSFDALGEHAGLVEVPRIAWFASKSSMFWEENLDLFPDESTFPRRPREVLCMERIFPLPEKIRHALIDSFCNPAIASKAKTDPANKDCLVRVLLGRRRFGASQPGGLDLDAEEYARSMADALAILHWHTKIDAMDIEFALGSTPLDRNAVRRALPLKGVERLVPGSSTYEHTTNADPNFKRRSVSLWLLDFDACSPITMDNAGVQKAVKAWLETDPFCPRPHAEDEYMQNLWRVFSERYIATGRKVATGKTSQSLPAKFINGILDEFAHRSSKRRH
ncbi:Protein of unknown function DUF3669, zinc finger protein [Penicillium camemberti]|uniref:DUF3669 domain-containing protein n=1 Tax=Penicillium camemberti (strain FM 013) TaxID=1429867 RepID=A0A0G4PME8_PENC3|nr:Protein of unknown function DUF3669, zinc finger protein [Penicillium camemberti]